MNRSQSPSTALRAPSPPLGEKDGMRGHGSWAGNTSKKLDMSWGHEPLLVSPLPALSPQGGERLAAGRVRGRFVESRATLNCISVLTLVFTHFFHNQLSFCLGLTLYLACD